METPLDAVTAPSVEPSAAISGPVLRHDDPATLPSGRGIRRTFRDPATQDHFERFGFAVVPFLDLATVEAVRAVFEQVGPAPGDERTGYFPGNVSSSAEWKRTVLGLLEPLVSSRIEEVLDDHHAFHTTFMVKWPGPDGTLQAHVDPTMVEDEGRNRSLNIWCPLVEPAAPGEPDRGFVRVVPGSTHLVTGSWYRARGGHVPSGLEPVEGRVLEQLARPVRLQLGEAIGLDHRLLHCSPPNESDVPRLVLAIGLRPAEARAIHVECAASGAVEMRYVDDEYFVRHPAVDMADYPLLCEVDRVAAPSVTGADIDRLAELGESPWIVPAPAAPPVAAVPAVAAPAATERGVVAAARRAVHRANRAATASPPVLRDATLDHRLRRDGFVKVPLLSPEAADDLREEFGRLRGWDGEGFVVDIWSPDAGYRRAAAGAIAAATDGPLSALFVDQQPFLRNFLVKWPGERDPDGFPEAPHRDWMYTDEPAGVKSWVVWLALEDIRGDNGQLRVARGSHHVDSRLRGSGIWPEWLGHRDVWDPRMLAVPTASGEAIILDSAVVHGSYANLGDRPRVAAAIALRPTGKRLVHFQRCDDEFARRYTIDDEFFINQDVELLGEPLDLPDGALVPIGGTDVSRRSLALLLDRQPMALVDRVERGIVGARARRGRRS